MYITHVIRDVMKFALFFTLNGDYEILLENSN